MQLSLVSVDIYSFYDWPVDLQILPLRTRSQCGVSDTQVTVDARGFLPASPKAKAGLGVQSLRPSVRPSVRPKILSSQLL